MKPHPCARLVTFLAVLGIAAPAAAETARCTDAGGKVSLSLDLTFADEGMDIAEVTRLTADLGDFTMSTAPTEPDVRAELIESQESEPGRLDVYLTDPDDIWIVLRLHLVRDVAYDRQYGDDTGEGRPVVVAGTLSVMGAGIWAVTCAGW